MTGRTILRTWVGVALVAAVGCLAVAAQGDIIATWGSTVADGDLEGATVTYAANAADSTLGSGATHTQGEGTAIPGGSIVYTMDRNTDATSSAAEAIDDDQYLQVSFEVAGLDAGYLLELESLTYVVHPNAKVNNNQTPPIGNHGWPYSQVAVRINDTAFAAADLLGEVNCPIADFTTEADWLENHTVVVPMSLTVANGDVVTFRIYGWGSVGDSFGRFAPDAFTELGGISIEGQSVVPEPASLTLIALGGLALLRRRR